MTKKFKDQKRRCKQSLKNETNFSKRNHTIRILQEKAIPQKSANHGLLKKIKFYQI
jgi:hypothetical protein